MIVRLTSAVLFAIACAAQTAGPPLAFEVASIKLSPPEHIGFQSYSPGPGRYRALTATVRNLITAAYSVRDVQIAGGPKWTESEAYDIEATAPGPFTNSERQTMLRNLLASRFALKLYRETREMNVYDLVVAKRGPTMTAAEKAGLGVSPGKLRIAGRGADMRTLAGVLSGTVDRIVRDHTGLSGYYDFALTWRPDDAPPDDQRPSLLTAIQEQLGLRLDPAKGPVEVLVIDAVSRPSSN